MRDLFVLLVHLTATLFRLAQPGGVRAVVAESVLIKHQLLIVNRSRQRAPNLRILDRLVGGFCSLWIKSTRFPWVAIAFRPSTLLHFHRALVQRKYRLLFSPKQRTKPGPRGPDADLIRAVIEMKQRNPTWGCPRIAEQINLAFGTSINKDVVRRVLAQHYQPPPKRRWSILANLLRTYQGQLVESRPHPMRIGRLANVLGARGHGPVHSPGHRFWNSGRRCRWFGALPHVQASHSRCTPSEIPEFRSRSAVSVSSMASKP